MSDEVQRWEYKVENVKSIQPLQPLLNAWGLDGWELVTDVRGASESRPKSPPQRILILKRPLRAEE